MNKIYAAIILLFAVLASYHIQAQSLQIKGVLADSIDHSTIIGAAVQCRFLQDTTQQQTVTTDVNGAFVIKGLHAGPYILKFTNLGYNAKRKFVKLETSDVDLGTIGLSTATSTLKAVNINETVTRVTQKNDTSQYNAAAFKTHPDATAEDLVGKMPGISTEGGTIKAHGEQVQKVLVDGKEFFGDDAGLALRNLPSDVVDKVQVFDRMSDQGIFTGFDDGNTQKTMNIVTRPGRNEGVFGKFYAGGGYIDDFKYSAGANVNWFKGNRRLSLISMFNNVNLQNFSMQDLVGLTGSSGGGRGGPGGRPGGGGGRGGQGGGGFGNSAAQNFLVGQQGGIANTNAIGLNFTDVWGKKKNLRFTGSYFFNATHTASTTDLTRKYFNAGDSAVNYAEHNTLISDNMNHRLNFRVEYLIDTNNALIFTPKFSYQDNRQNSTVDGNNYLGGKELLNSTQTNYQSKTIGYNAAADLLYQHKFRKAGRTISLNLGTNINNKDGKTGQQASSLFRNNTDTISTDQQSTQAGRSYNYNANLSYTEPIGQNAQLQLVYNPSYTRNSNDKETNKLNARDGLYDRLDTALSSKYYSDYITHKIGVTYRIKGNGYNLAFGLTEQLASLSGNTTYPLSGSTYKSFVDLLPNAMATFRFKNSSSLRINYRTNTNAPAISQLQNVIDNSNPLLLSSGNATLVPTYMHTINVRYGLANGKGGKSLFFFSGFNYGQHYIGNSTIIADKDTFLSNRILLRRGSQYSRPVNLNDYYTVNGFLNFGFPIKKIKCNINFSTGLQFAHTPSLVNNALNLSNNIAPSAGFVFSSNISEKIDFTISYNASYNIVTNTLQQAANNNYFNHSANAKFNWMFYKGFVFNTSLQNTVYAGVASGYNQNILLWNAALGYKFLKDKSLELKASVNDILNQNSGVSRNITDTYIEDSRNKVLQRYWMLTLTYNLKYYKKAPNTPAPSMP